MQIFPTFAGVGQLGGMSFNLPATPIILMGQVNTAGRYSTLGAIGGTAGYAVTALKTLKVRALIAAPITATPTSFLIFYGDNDVGPDNASTPTNPVYIGGGGQSQYPFATGLSQNGYYLGDLFSVPAGKYITMKSIGANSSAQLICFEV